jgi:hypothetical protein
MQISAALAWFKCYRALRLPNQDHQDHYTPTTILFFVFLTLVSASGLACYRPAMKPRQPELLSFQAAHHYP